jgi:hypothetical protein
MSVHSFITPGGRLNLKTEILSEDMEINQQNPRLSYPTEDRDPSIGVTSP